MKARRRSADLELQKMGRTLFTKPLLTLISIVTAGLCAAPQWAKSASIENAPARCSAVRSFDLSRLQDAPTQILETSHVAPINGVPGYCRVSGYVAPSVGFLMRLPDSNWNGKLIELGCGGYCGSTDDVECDDPLRRGYACIVSDAGHKSTYVDMLWAYHNLQAEIDFGYRAPHVTALAAKAIVKSYFNQTANHSYFMGCSGGGRQAMIEAQRFPWDFEGIIAGAPSLSSTGTHLSRIWWLRALTDKNRKPLFTRAEMEMVHGAALKQCDLDDGIKDGIIGNPAACHFDPKTLLCPAGKKGNCLSREQVDGLTKAYAGPTTSKGYQIYPSKAYPGAELNLVHTGQTSAEIEETYEFEASKFRYNAFDPAAGPNWQAEDLDFDQDYKRLGVLDALAVARDPDLRRYKSAGGKLLAYVGFNDIDQAGVTIDYYSTTEKAMGGRTDTQEFFRLFVVPGMNHCSWGDGAFAIDYLSYLEAWVERGKAPDHLLGSHVKLDSPMGSYSFPLDPARIEFSRPIYPFPTTAVYLDHGNPNDAQSFGPR
jgi:Tannase and feruloyl esterase